MTFLLREIRRSIVLTKRVRVSPLVAAMILVSTNFAWILPSCSSWTDNADSAQVEDSDIETLDVDVARDGGEDETDADVDRLLAEDADQDQQPDGSEADSLDADINESCDELEHRIRSELSHISVCETHEECIVHQFGVPEIARCFTAVNRAADLMVAEEAAATWRAAGCESRSYECPDGQPPEPRCGLTNQCRFVGSEYSRCAELRGSFAEEAERLNHCVDSSDCFLAIVLNCGIMTAPWIPIHIDADQTLLREIETEYGVMCCPYATCSAPLPLGGIQCDEGQCVPLYP